MENNEEVKIENNNEVNKTQNKKNNLGLIILVVSLILISIGIILLITNSSSSDNNENKELGNNTENIETTNNEENKEEENNSEENNQEETNNNQEESNGNQEENNQDNSNTIDIEKLEEMRTTLINDMTNNNYHAYIVNCTEIGNGETNNEYKEVSINAINTIFEKLKSASKMENGAPVGYIGNCTPRNVDFVITNIVNSLEGKKLIIMYDYTGKSLDVGYDGTPYDFYFENTSDLDNFLESLT